MNQPTEPTETDEHVCKPGARVYFCPTSGETESDCHGGFDVCCARPDLHQPTDEACEQLAKRLDAVRATAEAWIRPTMSAQSRAAGEHLLRVLAADLGHRLEAPAASSAGRAPATNPAPSHRAGLREQIAQAIEDAPYRPETRRSVQLADAVMPVLYREWPWLRAEAEDAAVLPAPAPTTNRAAILREVEQHVRELARATFQPYYRSAYATLADDISRLADETPATQTQPDTCRSIVVDGQTISVRGSGVPAELDLAFFGEVVRAAKRRYAAEHPDEPAVETVRPKREQPVYLSTPCAVCTHPYNWHCGRSACEFGTEENPCGCRSFTPGEEPAAGARQDGAQP